MKGNVSLANPPATSAAAAAQDQPITTTSSGTEQPMLPYVTLLTNEGHRVILPKAAAHGARFLQHLMRGVEAIHLAANSSMSSGSADHVAQQQHPRRLRVMDEDEGAGELFTCYAAADADCCIAPSPSPPACASASPAAACEGGSTAFASSTMLTVPLTCLDTDTLTRMVHFLVAKAAKSGQQLLPGADSVDVLKNLDRTDAKHQMKVINMFIGADFLGC